MQNKVKRKSVEKYITKQLILKAIYNEIPFR